jgi:tetratricopeptide (TPR) repeat protein
MRAAWLALLLVASCNRFTVWLTTPVMERGSRSFQAEADLEIARAAAPGQLKSADGLLESDPHNRILLTLLARGFLELAFGFVEDDLEATPPDQSDRRQALAARATALYDRALGFALRLIDTRHRGFSGALSRDAAAVTAAARTLGQESLPGLVFAGMALASAVDLNRDVLGRVVDLPKAIALLERAVAIDPRFYYGGAAMTLGLIYASQPAARGGRPELARRYFEQAIAASDGKYLLSRVELARAYAVAAGDRALFESTLQSVLATPASVLPSARLANEIARRRAARYLAHASEYF